MKRTSSLEGDAGGAGSPTQLSMQASAADIVRELAPNCLPSVFARLRREGILDAVDLAGLEKEDLRELGFTMLERSRLLRWGRDGPKGEPQLTPSPSFLSSDPLLGRRISADVETPDALVVEPQTAEEGEAQQRLDEVEQKADFWCHLVQEHAQNGSRRASGGIAALKQRTTSFSEEVEDVRENVLEGLFDLTSERVSQLYSRMQSRSSNGIVSLNELRHGLSRCGLPELDDAALTKMAEAVSKARRMKTQKRGIELAEFEAILSRLKLAQLLTSASALPLDKDTLGGRRERLGWGHVVGNLMAVDYNSQSASKMDVSSSKFREFFFGHRKPVKTFGDPPLVRWVHMAGLDLTLLLALTVKYSLHPLGVEDVIEQCPTKIDRYGNHYFAVVEQLCLASPTDGSQPVRVHGRHVAIFCSGPPLFDTILTISEPDHDEKEDWPGGATRDATGFGDAWVERLRERLEASHSRLRERRADFLMYQILDLNADEIVRVTRAYTTRLNLLETQPQLNAAGAIPDWTSEVQLAQMQLAVVARRIRGLQRLIRRVIEDSDLNASLSGYAGDVRDHIDEANEDVVYLSEKCRSLLEGSERAMERHQAFCRTRADERLNMMVFVLTGATAIFAPVQFFAGVYGMNFVYADGTPSIPELTWPRGYLYFWVLVITYLLVSSTCAVLLHRRFRRKRKEDFKNATPVAAGLGALRPSQHPAPQTPYQRESSLPPAPWEGGSPSGKQPATQSLASTSIGGGSTFAPSVSSAASVGATPASNGLLRVPLLGISAAAAATPGGRSPNLP